MEYRHLGSAGVRVSPLCLGTMMFGGPTEEAESIRIIHRALDEGINFLDTANVYNGGASETVVGKALKGRRESVVLATKVRGNTGDGPNDRGTSVYHIMMAVENSLRRLDTDHIDLYLLHRHEPETPIEESLEALDRLVQQGKVRYIGCSNFDGWQLCQALWTSDRRNLARFVAVQPLYNIVNRDIEMELLPCCAEYGIGVMAYSPLARGVLSGKYGTGEKFPEGSRAARADRRILETEVRAESFEVATRLKPIADRHGRTMTQFALNWVISNAVVTAAIIGPRTMAQLEDNLGAVGWSIDDDALDEIDRLVPPGEHTGKGFPDPSRPFTGRPRRPS